MAPTWGDGSLIPTLFPPQAKHRVCPRAQAGTQRWRGERRDSEVLRKKDGEMRKRNT